MKKIIIVLSVVMMLISNGCSAVMQEINTPEDSNSKEIKRIDLYVKVMEAAYDEENGGNAFIAVKIKTLEGLSDEGKQEVLNRLKNISKEVYAFEDVVDDHTKFEKDENGNLIRAIDGTLLSVRLEKYTGINGTIEATSWFGNLGAVFPRYKASYKNGKWTLELISMAIS